MALQSITSPDTHPELHYFVSSPGVAKEGVWKSSPEALCEALINVNRIVSQALEPVIEHHISTGNPIVLEGDGILPELAAKYVASNNSSSGNIRAVFLYESDKERFFRSTLDLRGKTYDSESQERLTINTMHWLYGQWITQETNKHHLPSVQSHPWDTLEDRVLHIIQ